MFGSLQDFSFFPVKPAPSLDWETVSAFKKLSFLIRLVVTAGSDGPG